MVNASKLLFRIPGQTSWMDLKEIEGGKREIIIPFENAKIYTPIENKKKDMVRVSLYPNTMIEIKDTKRNDGQRFGKIRYDLALQKYSLAGI